MVAAGAALSEPQAVGGPAGPSGDHLSIARLRAQLADPAVQVCAHRDDASARLVLQVRERATGKVIEQYPPDQLLRFYAALRESLGALFDQRA